jgi:oligopeptide/dipeptide ABC transporter ATP-binding protein
LKKPSERIETRLKGLENISLNAEVILAVKNLVTTFDTEAGKIRAVDNVSFQVQKGSTLGIVGESGCGKSVTALSVLRLLPKPTGNIEQGQILMNGEDINQLPKEKMYEIRGHRIAMIFQEPMTALNPVYKIGNQLAEVYQLHFPEMDEKEIWEQSVEMLHKVGIPEPAQRMEEYPHQISGGMRQRVMIASALAGSPEILIADEPTTALDVTIQAQILDLMKSLQRETGMAIIFITHDLGVIAETCDDVLVMYAGTVAETASVVDLFKNPAHPYTLGLVASIPRLEGISKTKLTVIRGMVPSLFDLPDGCRFSNRCPYKMVGCEIEPPALRTVNGADHLASCYLY